ncbi:MAG: acyl-CoA dehydrogenase family protein [Solirubrobacteraceae bacterium]|jgi:acyl-CoA dehydrogenase
MDSATYLSEIERIARDTAAPNAATVDREPRFPSETLAALKRAGALSAAVPTDLGGSGLEPDAIARSCTVLARACSASAMIFAMHQIQVLLLVRHRDGAQFFEDYLRRLAAEQRLIASATSERGTGGDLGRSIAAVEDAGAGKLKLTKQCSVLSYGEDADDYLTTLRRSPQSEQTDQVLVLHTAEQTRAEATGTWDPLGVRGTLSPPFTLSATFTPEQIVATPFARTMTESMVPLSHLLWSRVWLGIASEAYDRAHACVRSRAHSDSERVLPGAQRLASVGAELSLLRAEVARALQDFDAIGVEEREKLSTLSMILRFNNLKIACSELSVRVTLGALEVIGLEGYASAGEHSVERLVRDILSAPLQVSNERIRDTDARLLLIAKERD